MTNSMTGFSRCSTEQATASLVWELRTVNHRYLDVIVKLPEDLRGLESAVRKRIAETIKRGKVECHLRYKSSETEHPELLINEDYATAILKACQKISKPLHQPSELNVIEVLKWPGVVRKPEIDLSPVMTAALDLFDQALNDLCESKKSEGQRMQVMLEERCAAMKLIVAQERKRRPELVNKTREKLLDRIKELAVEHDANRFEQEIAYITQKMDVDEELDRLESHFVEIEKILNRNEAIGRRLDFMMQELNREANTLGSKSADIETTQASVELKVLIEQMREQVQNIE